MTPNNRQNGRVIFISDTKNFGFLKGDDGNDFFIPASEVGSLRKNERVSFESKLSRYEGKSPRALAIVPLTDNVVGLVIGGSRTEPIQREGAPSPE